MTMELPRGPTVRTSTKWVTLSMCWERRHLRSLCWPLKRGPPGTRFQEHRGCLWGKLISNHLCLSYGLGKGMKLAPHLVGTRHCASSHTFPASADKRTGRVELWLRAWPLVLQTLGSSLSSATFGVIWSTFNFPEPQFLFYISFP